METTFGFQNFQNFDVQKNRNTFTMAEKHLFLAKIGDFTGLGDPILTNYTIFLQLQSNANSMD